MPRRTRANRDGRVTQEAGLTKQSPPPKNASKKQSDHCGGLHAKNGQKHRKWAVMDEVGRHRFSTSFGEFLENERPVDVFFLSHLKYLIFVFLQLLGNRVG